MALALVIVGGVLLAGAWGWAQRKPMDETDLSFFVDAPPTIHRLFDAHPPKEAVRLAERELDAKITLHPLDNLQILPPPEQRRLREGRSVAVPGRPVVWIPRLQEGLAVEARIRKPPPLPMWPAVGIFVLLGLGLAVGLQLRPLQGQLNTLAAAAGKFGQGDRKARVSLPPAAPTRELGEAFNSMADQVTALLDGQEQLLLAVSHELRTPLHRLRFAIELLSEEEDVGKRATRLEELQVDLDELDGLVGELLTWGRLGADTELVRSEVDLRDLAEQLASEARALRPELEVEVCVPDCSISADPALIARAWRNGVVNGVRHAAGKIRIAIERADGEVFLEVHDDGPGVPEADRERIFDPFVRLDEARTADRGGVGLGLALVSRISARHGGRTELVASSLGGAALRIAFAVGGQDGK